MIIPPEGGLQIGHDDGMTSIFPSVEAPMRYWVPVYFSLGPSLMINDRTLELEPSNVRLHVCIACHRGSVILLWWLMRNSVVNTSSPLYRQLSGGYFFLKPERGNY